LVGATNLRGTAEDSPARVKWEGPKYTITDLGGGKWDPYITGGGFISCKETSRNADFIEIKNSAGVLYRVYNDKMLSKTEFDTTWEERDKGKWVK
jgi:hypothetical protein